MERILSRPRLVVTSLVLALAGLVATAGRARAHDDPSHWCGVLL